MKVTVKGKGFQVNLDQSNFIAKGGEGEIYAKGNVAYKICGEDNMIPEGKFRELSVMTDPHIIKPEDILINAKNKSIGYTLKFVPDNYTLVQLMTKAFCEKNKVTPDIKLSLIKQMQNVIATGIHPHKILLVDLNEMNFLCSKDFKDIWFIDVNSYQTPSYPATAIMDSIRDRHCHHGQFTTNTDYYSYGIVTFRLLIGIHPFKGSHPKVPNAKGSMDERMKLNLSVLNKDASYPEAACYPLSIIPPVYRKWYEAIFERGERVPPPKSFVETIAIVPVIRQIVGSNNFNISEIGKYDSEVLKYFYHFGKEIVVTSNSVYIDKRVLKLDKDISHFGFTPKTTKPIGAYFEGLKVKLLDMYTMTEIPLQIEGSNMMDYDGRIYVQTGTSVIEIVLNEHNGNVIPMPVHVGNCMERSTQFFSGVVIQNIFGMFHASIFPESKSCCQFALKEFDVKNIIDAKFQNNVLVVVGTDKNGTTSQAIYRLDKDMQLVLMSIEKDISFMGINFTVLESGVCLLMNDKENLLVFRNEPSSLNSKEIDDSAIKADMQFASKGSTAIAMQGNKLYSVSMRK